MAKKKSPKLSTKLKKLLGTASKKFKKTEAVASQFVNENVADGQYAFDLVGAGVSEFGSGKARVEFRLKLTEAVRNGDEDSIDEEVVSGFWLETEQNLSFLKKTLSLFVDVDDDDFDLAAFIEEGGLDEIAAEEPSGVVNIRMNGDFQNVNIIKLDEGGGDEDEEEEEEDKPKKKKGGKKKKDVEEEEEEEEEAPEIAKGDTVLFTPPKAKKAKEFTVTKLKGGKADLEDDDGNEFKGILLAKLELVDPENDDEEEEEEEPKKKVRAGGPKKKKSSKDEDEEEEEEEDADLEEGDKVSFNFKGKECKGTVEAIDEEEETVEVVFKHDGKKMTKEFPADKLELIR